MKKLLLSAVFCTALLTANAFPVTVTLSCGPSFTVEFSDDYNWSTEEVVDQVLFMDEVLCP